MWRRLAASAVTSALLLASSGCDRVAGVERALSESEAQASPPPSAGPSPQSSPPRLAPPEGPVVPRPGAPASFTQLVRQSRASVVNIHTTAFIRQRPVMVPDEDSPYLFNLVEPPAARARSLGTGFLISATGEILTNNHVVAPEELGGRVADEIVVKLDDKREFRARVIARDAPTDLALLKIDAPGVQPLPFGDSDVVEVGEWVVAIGQPYGLASTVTAGIISAKGRQAEELGGGPGHGEWDFLQTDCAINPGNSGGPLVNMRGEVVGINTAINAKAQGLAFAVPINMAKRIIADLGRFGRVQRGWLGLRPIDNPRAQGIALDTGALIGQVVRGSPAHRAGLGRGDLILAFDGVPVTDAERLRWLTAKAGVGRAVTLRVQRGQQVVEVPMTTLLQPE